MIKSDSKNVAVPLCMNFTRPKLLWMFKNNTTIIGHDGVGLLLYYDYDCLFSHFQFPLTRGEVKDKATTSCKYCITPISPPQQSSGTFKALLKAQTKTKQANTEHIKERLVFCVTHGMAHLTSEGKPKRKTLFSYKCCTKKAASMYQYASHTTSFKQTIKN